MKLTLWHVLALAIVIIFLLISAGKWAGGHTILLIFGFIMLGAIYPPLAIGIGLIAVFRILLTHPNLASNPLTSFLNAYGGSLGTNINQIGTKAVPGSGNQQLSNIHSPEHHMGV